MLNKDLDQYFQSVGNVVSFDSQDPNVAAQNLDRQLDEYYQSNVPSISFPFDSG